MRVCAETHRTRVCRVEPVEKQKIHLEGEKGRMEMVLTKLSNEMKCIGNVIRVFGH